MDKIQLKWDRTKQKYDIQPCPSCDSKRIHLNHSIMKRFYEPKYWLECWDCHWCGSYRRTIRGAIRHWNIQGDVH